MKKIITAVFCIFLFFVAGLAAELSDAAQGRRGNSVEIIYDQRAVSQEYKRFFKLFRNELTQVFKKNPGRIFGRHRILVLELVNSKNPDDMRFFVLLDSPEPVIVHWQRAGRLTDDKALQDFVEEAAQRTFEILCEESRVVH